MRTKGWLRLCATAAAAAAGALYAWTHPPASTREALGLRLRLPSSWTLESSESSHLRVLRLKPNDGPLLVLERHLAPAVGAEEYARGIPGRVGEPAEVTLGQRTAWRVRSVPPGEAAAEAGAARSLGPPAREQYVFELKGSLVVAGNAVPRADLRGWRHGLLVRGVLAALESAD